MRQMQFPSEEKSQNTYSIQIDKPTAKKLQDYCGKNSSLKKREVPYSLFAYKSESGKFSVTVYNSLKFVVNGKGTRDFIQNVFEPEITGKALLGYDEVWHPEWFELHAGLDESGKGDVFGPLVTCCVIAGNDAVKRWCQAGVRDSKTIADNVIFKMEKLIRETPGVIVKVITPADMKTYNNLYATSYPNMNKLLTYLHFTTLREALVEAKATNIKMPKWGLLDQFSKAPLVQNELKRHEIEFDLRMRTKAESDPVVAAASIVARAKYLTALADLSKKAKMRLPKGCSPDAVDCLKKICENFGKRRLVEFAKVHFSTVKNVLAST